MSFFVYVVIVAMAVLAAMCACLAGLAFSIGLYVWGGVFLVFSCAALGVALFGFGKDEEKGGEA